MKFPKLCAVPTLLYYLVCLLSTSLFSQIATPTFETSHGPGPSITICEDTPVTFLVLNVPANSLFSFFRVPDGGSPQQLSVSDPTLAQITFEEHALNDTFFAEIVYSQSGVTSITQTTSITIDYFPSPTNLVLSTNLANSFYCADTPVEITAAGADFYEFFLDGISQGASSTTDVYITTTYTTSDTFNLPGGKAYKITAYIDVSNFNTNTGDIRYRFWLSSISNTFGAEGVTKQVGSTSVTTAPATAIFYSANPVTVRLQISYSSDKVTLNPTGSYVVVESL